MSVALMALTGSVYGQLPRDGLLAWYPFTGSAEDMSGHDRDLTTIEGYSPIDTTDRYDSSDCAYWYTGSGAVVPFHTKDSWLPSGDEPWSVCAWTFPAGRKTCVVSWGIQEEPNKKVSITQTPTSDHSGSDLCVSNGTDSLKAPYWSPSESRKWYHVVVTHDSNTTKIYINGEERLSSDIDLSIENGSFLGIGGEASSDDTFTRQREWRGKLDDVALYNKVLTSAQISDIYESKTALNNPPSITSEPEEITFVDMTYTYEISADDPENHDVTYHLLEGPSGAEISGNTLSCNTTGLELNDYPVKIAAVDEMGDSSYQEYTLTITAEVSIEKPIRAIPKYHESSGSSAQQRYFTITGRALKPTRRTSGIYLRSHKVLVLPFLKIMTNHPANFNR
jgi:hypothetical protein